jgi:hypothetical protein
VSSCRYPRLSFVLLRPVVTEEVAMQYMMPICQGDASSGTSALPEAERKQIYADHQATDERLGVPMGRSDPGPELGARRVTEGEYREQLTLLREERP